jgi:hypothetical protein
MVSCQLMKGACQVSKGGRAGGLPLTPSPRPAPSLSVESLRVESGKGIGVESHGLESTMYRTHRSAGGELSDLCRSILPW